MLYLVGENLTLRRQAGKKNPLPCWPECPKGGGGAEGSIVSFKYNGFRHRKFFYKKEWLIRLDESNKFLQMARKKGMTKELQIVAFKGGIEAVIERFSAEFDLNYSEMIGVLEETKFWLLLESVDLVSDEEEEEEEEEDDDGEGWKTDSAT